MKLFLFASFFALLPSNSDAAAKTDKRLGRSNDKNPAPEIKNIASKMPTQQATKGEHDVEPFLLGRRAMQETARYSVLVTVGSIQGDRQNFNSEKQATLTENKAKGLHSTSNKAGAYHVTSKLRNKEYDDATTTQSQIELDIVGGDQSGIGEFPYYGTSQNRELVSDYCYLAGFEANIISLHLLHSRYAWMWWNSHCS